MRDVRCHTLSAFWRVEQSLNLYTACIYSTQRHVGMWRTVETPKGQVVMRRIAVVLLFALACADPLAPDVEGALPAGNHQLVAVNGKSLPATIVSEWIPDRPQTVTAGALCIHSGKRYEWSRSIQGAPREYHEAAYTRAPDGWFILGDGWATVSADTITVHRGEWVYRFVKGGDGC